MRESLQQTLNRVAALELTNPLTAGVMALPAPPLDRQVLILEGSPRRSKSKAPRKEQPAHPKWYAPVIQGPLKGHRALLVLLLRPRVAPVG